MPLYDFLNRRDSYANWMNNNIIVPSGVMGIINDSPAGEFWFVVGNGTDHFGDLHLFKIQSNAGATPATNANVYVSSNEPTDSDINDNDIWIVV